MSKTSTVKTKRAPAVKISGDTLTVDFERFDLKAYEMFLKVKRLPEYTLAFDREAATYSVSAPARFAPMLGVPLPKPERSDLSLAKYLFDDQRAVVRMALDAKRFAAWLDTGLGKTAILLEFARHVAHRTGGRVMICTLANLVEQTLEMAQQFYGDKLKIVRLTSQAQMRRWCATGSTEKEIDHGSEEEGGGGTEDRSSEDDRAGRAGDTKAAVDDRGNRQGDDGNDRRKQKIRERSNGQTGSSRRRKGDDRGGAQEVRPLIAITNYEKFNPEKGKTGKEAAIPEVRQLAGFILDESSRLAMGGGKQKWVIIHSTKGIPYKLSCTATPAPNDTMEFASQASFLERMRSEGEIIWTYFTRHPKTHRWAVKKHARKAFFEFLSSWSIYVRDPERYGWRKGMKKPPEPVILHHPLEPTLEQKLIATQLTTDPSGQGHLFIDRETNTVERSKLSQVAKGFRYVTIGDAARRLELVPSPKPQFISDLIAAESKAGHQVLVWTVFDAESDLIARALADAHPSLTVHVLTGKVAKPLRGPMLERFRRGDAKVLISRASMLGFGMNFQHCSSMIFSGWSDSYVAWYQAIRRAYRFGQTKRVRVHVPVIPELEGQMLDNIAGKGTRHEAEIKEMEENYLRAIGEMRSINAAVCRKGAAA